MPFSSESLRASGTVRISPSQCEEVAVVMASGDLTACCMTAAYPAHDSTHFRILPPRRFRYYSAAHWRRRTVWSAHLPAHYICCHLDSWDISSTCLKQFNG